MQLAASQRAHPPPVPPRPSRQVVAEALKKSPRPPCPTRQAPPPPNQRPWRQEEQKQPENGNVSGGRTIVYDSANKPASAEKPEVEQRRRSSLEKDKEEKRPPTKESPAARAVNGKDHQRENEPPIIDENFKRKEEIINDAANNNNNILHDKDQCDGPVLVSTKEIQLEGSAERKKKKAQNVTFKEVQAVGESAGSPPLSPSRKSPEKCATVVVIDEVEGARVTSSCSSHEESDNIQTQDWLEAGVRYTSTKITLPAEEVVVVNGHSAQPQQQQEEEEEEEEEEGEADKQLEEFGDLDFSSIIERIAMSSLQGLPPLPRSLSGFNLNGAGLVVEPAPPPPARSTSKSQRAPKTPTSSTSLSSQGSRPSPQGRQLTTLDTQLAILRREMFGLRQLDLSLLSQLWSLNESIQEFRQLLQEQEDRAPSPSPSSEEGDETSYGGSSSNHQQPPPPPRRPAPATPLHHMHHQQQQHHHRPMRAAARCTKMPLSDDSPSSEEYGAV